MATNIQASQTSGLIISPDQSGVLTLQSGSNTATMPAATGTVMVSGNMPAFSAYSNGGTSVTTATQTKLAFDTKVFDTANCYDTTNYRFKPTVAGYYQINAATRFGSMSATQCYLSIYVSGSRVANGFGGGVSSGYVWPGASAIVYCNGSTDYVEIYAYQTSGSTQSTDYTSIYQFSGSLVRTA